ARRHRHATQERRRCVVVTGIIPTRDDSSRGVYDRSVFVLFPYRVAKQSAQMTEGDGKIEEKGARDVVVIRSRYGYNLGAQRRHKSAAFDADTFADWNCRGDI